MNKTYLISDFYLACYLKAKDYKLFNVERDERKTTFIFEDEARREKDLKDFYNDGVLLEILKVEFTKFLKSFALLI